MEENARFSKQEEVFDLSEIVEQGDMAEHGSGSAADAEDAVIELTETVPAEALSAETASVMEKAPADSDDESDIHELVDIATDETGAEADDDADVLDLLADDIDDAPLELPGMEEKPAPEVAGGLFPAEAEEAAEPSGSAPTAGPLSQSGHDEEAPAPSEKPEAPETPVAPEITEGEGGAASVPAEECTPSDAASVSASDGDAPVAPSAPQKREDDVEEVVADDEKDAFLSLAAELEARLNALAARYEAEAQTLMARLDAAEQRALTCEAQAEEHQRRFDAELEALAARLAAAEQRNEELTIRAAELEAQLEACSARTVDAETLRLELEASAGRMIDERMAALLPAEGSAMEAVEVGADAPCETEASAENGMTGEGDVTADESVDSEAGAPENSVSPSTEEVFYARVDDIAAQVGELEARVAGWELRCEQEAALAAARVIREEIAALRADAARTGR